MVDFLSRISQMVHMEILLVSVTRRESVPSLWSSRDRDMGKEEGNDAKGEENIKEHERLTSLNTSLIVFL